MKEQHLVSMKEILSSSCVVISVDVSCVSDVIFRCNVFLIGNFHCVKNVRIRGYSGPYFPALEPE